MLAAKLPTREWKQLKGIEVAGHLCDYEGEVSVREGSTPDGFGRCWWRSEECWYRGLLERGCLQGDGMLAMRNGDRFYGRFCEDRPAGAGVLATLDGRRFKVEYAPNDSMLNDLVPLPVSSCPCSEHVIEQVTRVREWDRTGCRGQRVRG